MSVLQRLKGVVFSAKLTLMEFGYLSKHFGSSDTMADEEKLRGLLIMQTHIIEKGLSLRDVRAGFGQPKVKNILSKLKEYINRYDNPSFVEFVLTNVCRYISFQQENSIDIKDIEERYAGVLAKAKEKWPGFDVTNNIVAGTFSFTREEFTKAVDAPFPEFFKSRHSVRQFADTPVDEAKIREALDLCRYTPSACNRQPWKVTVSFDKTMIDKILTWQHGSRQFKDMVSCVLVVSGSAHPFFGYEYHQHYVNAGMYTMSLLLALHYQQLGAIPLNVVFDRKQLKEISDICGFDDGELPVTMIAVGNLDDSFKVACSYRFPYESYTRFI